MTHDECTAEELCRQYMGRAKETITWAGHRIKEREQFIHAIMGAQNDLSFAMLLIGRQIEGDKK